MAFEWIIIKCRCEIRKAQARRCRAWVARFFRRKILVTESAITISPPPQHMINIEDFIKVEIKIGKILSAEKVDGSEKLLKLMIDLGEANPRQILSGVAKAVPNLEDIVGKMVPITSNLEPRQMMGMESQGMMLCTDDGAPVLLHPAKEVPPGSLVK